MSTNTCPSRSPDSAIASGGRESRTLPWPACSVAAGQLQVASEHLLAASRSYGGGRHAAVVNSQASALTLLVVLYSCAAAAAGLCCLCVRECALLSARWGYRMCLLGDEMLRNGVVIGFVVCRGWRTLRNSIAAPCLPTYVVCNDGRLLEIRLQARAYHFVARRSLVRPADVHSG